MADRLCVFCKHFNLDMGDPGYSEMTPGYDAIIECCRNHWEMSQMDDVSDYRKNIERAQTCPDYRHYDERWIRARFLVKNALDPRPINWPVKHPYWVTGYSANGRAAVIVTYADDERYILDNWPDATEIDSVMVVAGKYAFSSRFPRPDWFKEDEANG